MCMRTHMEENVGHMTFDTFKNVFKSGVPYSIKLNWRGEPLLHKDVTRFIEEAKAMGVAEVSMNTNGLLLHRDLIYDLAYAGLDWLIVSADGAYKNTYEEIRKGGDFNVLVKNMILCKHIYELLPYSPKIRIQICKQPKNEFEMTEWKRFWGPFADELRIGKLFDPQGRYGYKKAIPKTCSQLWQRMTVSWKGNIYPCPSDYLGKVYIGNVNSTTIHEAWHGEWMTHLRDRLTAQGRSGNMLCKDCSSYCK